MSTIDQTNFQVTGKSRTALFHLKVHRGDGMVLLAMNWKKGKPTNNFVGFAIEYREPSGEKFFALKNRLRFSGDSNSGDANSLSTLRSPIQKFRWVHFPRNAELHGEFEYRVTPVFMNELEELSYGVPQTVAIELRRETYPGQLNITFTRGFVSSQAFVDRYQSNGNTISELLPPKSDQGLIFKPTHPEKKEALSWMGFEARHAILELLDKAIKEKADVRVIAYDLNEPEIVSRLAKIGKKLRIIIDDDGAHGKDGSSENLAEKRLVRTAGRANVKRQHMGKLQHNKTIIVDGAKTKTVVGGSTNFSWRGLYVQANNALFISGRNAVKIFNEAFNNYWENDTVSGFSDTASARWNDLAIKGVKAKVAFSPHNSSNELLESIADDIANKTTSSLFYSLAFLFQTPGMILHALNTVTNNNDIFVYGISDKKVKGIDLHTPDGNVAPVYPGVLEKKNLPEPFKSEPSGGGGNRMHHKFVVIDFDKPSARVYLGSYNFSNPADKSNGENLFLIKDRRIAVSYMIEALRIFDHYHFRVAAQNAKKAGKKLALAKLPVRGGKPWWHEDYTDPRKIKDRELFSA